MRKNKKYVLGTTIAVAIMLSSYAPSNIGMQSSDFVSAAEDADLYYQQLQEELESQGTLDLGTHVSALDRGPSSIREYVDDEGIETHHWTYGTEFQGQVFFSTEDVERYGGTMFYDFTYEDFDGNVKVLESETEYNESYFFDFSDGEAGVYTVTIKLFDKDTDELDKQLIIEVVKQATPNIKLDESGDFGLIDNQDDRTVTLGYSVVHLVQEEYSEETGLNQNPIIATGDLREIDKGIFEPDLDYDSLSEGDYYIDYIAYVSDDDNPYVTESLLYRDRAYFTKETPAVLPELTSDLSIKVENKVNPEYIDAIDNDMANTLEWEILDSSDKKVAGGSGISVNVNTISELEDGDYSVIFTEKNSDGANTSRDSNFERVNPNVTVEAESENPTAISISRSKADNSELSWTLTGDNNHVSEGQELTVGNSLMTSLKKGTYVFTVVETDIYDKTDTVTHEFTVTEDGSAGIVSEEEKPEEDRGTDSSSHPVTTPKPARPEDVEPEEAVVEEEEEIIVDYPVQDSPDASEEPDYLVDEETGEIVIDEDGNPVLNTVDELQQTGLTMILTQVGFLLLALGGGLYFWKGKKPKSEENSEDVKGDSDGDSVTTEDVETEDVETEEDETPNE